MNTVNNNKDLLQFISVYQPNKYKMLRSGIEIRGIGNIPNSISFANQVIQKFKLKLSIRHTADMATYGGFEVIPN